MIEISVAKGNGIVSQIMDATVEIFLSAGAKFELDAIEVDEKVHLAGNTSESQLNQSQQSGEAKYF